MRVAATSLLLLPLVAAFSTTPDALAVKRAAAQSRVAADLQALNACGTDQACCDATLATLADAVEPYTFVVQMSGEYMACACLGPPPYDGITVEENVNSHADLVAQGLDGKALYEQSSAAAASHPDGTFIEYLWYDLASEEHIMKEPFIIPVTVCGVEAYAGSGYTKV